MQVWRFAPADGKRRSHRESGQALRRCGLPSMRDKRDGMALATPPIDHVDGASPEHGSFPGAPATSPPLAECALDR